MCEPTTIMATAAVVSGAYTANQQIQQGKYQQGVAEYNARVAENEAQEVQNKSVEEENLQRRRTAELLSKQRAQLGAANVDLSSGSALQLQEDTVALGEADAMRIRSNYDYQVDALEQEAEFQRKSGEAARDASRSAAFGTLLKTGASVLGTGVADKWFTADSAATSLAGSPVPISSGGVVGDPLTGVA